MPVAVLRSMPIVALRLLWYKTRPWSANRNLWAAKGGGITSAELLHTRTDTAVGVPGKPGRQLGYVED